MKTTQVEILTAPQDGDGNEIEMDAWRGIKENSDLAVVAIMQDGDDNESQLKLMKTQT